MGSVRSCQLLAWRVGPAQLLSVPAGGPLAAGLGALRSVGGLPTAGRLSPLLRGLPSGNKVLPPLNSGGTLPSQPASPLLIAPLLPLARPFPLAVPLPLAGPSALLAAVRSTAAVPAAGPPPSRAAALR